MNPWDWNAKQITRLSDRIDVLPSVREATVTVTSPLTVRFDTDTVGTVVFGSLAPGLNVGDRVLTVRVARYVWVLGVRTSGAFFAGRFRATSTSDASLSSTEHGFQVGPDNSLNIIVDNNEIMARNNGAASQLTLNADGGDVRIGDASSVVNVPGTFGGDTATQGRFTDTNPRGFKFNGSISQDPTTSFTTVALAGTANYAVTCAYGSNGFTITQAGWYEISGTVTMDPGTDGLGTSIMAAGIGLNGSTAGLADGLMRHWPQSNNATAMNVQIQRFLAVNDVITLMAARSAALTGCTVTAANLSIRRVH